ncbi:MAG: arsenate reductase ArsC [Thermoplasmata archaeon]|nr:arsenate reductase ArsC [Thermoplasmata archaeon]
MSGDRQRILFLCTGNTCRSQMAEGHIRHQHSYRFDVESAGAMPSEVNPNAIGVMEEIGIDISGQRSRSVEEFIGQRFDYVITLCGDSSRDVRPSFIGDVGERLDWNFPDPYEARGSQEEILETYRNVRDGLREKIDDFVSELDEVT